MVGSHGIQEAVFPSGATRRRVHNVWKWPPRRPNPKPHSARRNGTSAKGALAVVSIGMLNGALDAEGRMPMPTERPVGLAIRRESEGRK